MSDLLAGAIANLQEQKALEIAREMIASGDDPLHIVEVARRGMDEVGLRYERNEYYLSGLIMSGEIFNEIVYLLDYEPPPGASGVGSSKVVMGAPLGDVHDIGKDIVSTLLRCDGFEVVDLGVSVLPSRFVQAVRESGAGIVGISTLITVAYESIRETVLAFEQAGLRDGVKIMLGGGAISGKVRDYTGADAWGPDAGDAVAFAKAFTGKEFTDGRGPGNHAGRTQGG